MRRYQEKFIICPTEQSYDWAKKQTKVRIVFDGSAKIDQCTSLNEALYSGPLLSCTIFDILFRFRLHNLMGIARPRDVHKTSLLGPSVRPSMYRIVRLLDVLFQSSAAVLIEHLSGLPMDVQRLHEVEHQIFHM